MKTQDRFPDRPNNINKKGLLRLPDRATEKYVIVDEICIPQTGLESKLIYLQKIPFDGEKTEFRLCYYIIGKLPNMKGRWVFGQFATFLPAQDFKAITDEARKRGWIQ
jgi:hypothetical protein